MTTTDATQVVRTGSVGPTVQVHGKGFWSAVCVPHQQARAGAGLAQALEGATRPEVWCPGCQEVCRG